MKAWKFLLLPVMITAAAACGGPEDEYSVRQGRFVRSITETGELEAISSVPIDIPILKWEYGYSYTVSYMEDNGKMVHAGDTVLRLDNSGIQKIIITKEEQLVNEKATLEKLRVQMANNIQDLQAQLMTEQAMYDLRKLEQERSRFDTDSRRRIRELEFRQATIRMEKVRRQIKRKPALDSLDYKVQRIKVMQVEAELATARELIERLNIVSPSPGLFQIEQSYYNYPPKPYRIGDRVHIGEIVAKIPDVSRMKVRSAVDEADYTSIRKGMKVIVRLDAMPGTAFNGRVTDIARSCINQQDRGKVFRVVVEIDESDLRLKPGMTVSCEYLSDEVENALFVPNSCLYSEGGRQFVFLRNGGTPEKREVEAGRSNSHHTLIRGGVEAGEPLVPFDEVLNRKNS